MSNVINNSNINSSLVNTLLASQSVTNPNVYSTMPIYPASATTYSKINPSNGDVISPSGGGTNFNINKYGIATQFLLSYKKTVTNTDASDQDMKLPQNDVFNVIKKVDLYSGSSLISSLSKYDLMAQWSDLRDDELNAIKSSALEPRTSTAVTAGANVTFTVTLPLTYGLFKHQNTCPNTSFLEVLSIRVQWSDDYLTAGGTGAVATVHSSQMVVRYKNYMQEANTNILEQNYGSTPQLNQLSSRFYDENASPTLVVNSKQPGNIKVELKSTDVVQSFFVILTNVSAPTLPVKIENVTFIGSGAEILNLSNSELQYMKLQDNGWARRADADTSGNALFNVVKVQTGVTDNAVWSNGASLREINSPQFSVDFVNTTATNNTYQVQIVEESSILYEIMSATGKLSVSLSN